jgi:hemerythrin-like domain-containing protein
MKPTEELRAEHDGILWMLEILEKISGTMAVNQAAQLQHLDQVMEFLKVFVDQCHHGKEEQILFPALETAGIAKQGGPIGVMLHEHQIGRGHVKAMSDALASLKGGTETARLGFAAAAGQYLDLLRQHIRKENEVLFPMADQVLSAEQQDHISDQFERLEKEKVGEGRHEAFHMLMEDLARIYLK